MICTVALCTRGRPELVARSLPRLVEAAREAGDAEVVVVEQGGRHSEALAGGLGARYIADVGRGVCRSRNIAAAAAAGEILLYTDDDCLVPASWVIDHRAALDDQLVSATFGVVAGLPRGGGGDPAAVRRRHVLGSAPWDIGHSSNMAVRREWFAAIGGFDERLGPGGMGMPAGDDPDFIVRLLAAGAVVEAGVGQPVEHMDWRSAADDLDALVSYEWGAGAWMGAALRAGRPYVRRHVRIRAGMLRERCRERLAVGDPATAVRLVAGFCAGFGRGLLLRPWPAAGPTQRAG